MKTGQPRIVSWWRLVPLLLLTLLGSGPAFAQLNENCTVTILNRSVQVQPDGVFFIPNIPFEPGLFRVRVTCTENGETTGGQSGFLTLTPNGLTFINNLTLGSLDPLPVLLQIDGTVTSMDTQGQTAQLQAIAFYADGSDLDVTSVLKGTFWSTSNPRVAVVSENGLVTALSRGRAIIQARNEGVIASYSIDIVIPLDSDGDGMSDDFERANGFNVSDVTDANSDADSDTLTNKQEFDLGTNPRLADTDRDGLADASESLLSTSPKRADTDADGLNDGQEVALGTNPTDPDSDDDQVPDGLELELGLNPLVATPTTTVRGRIVDGNGLAVPGASAVVFDAITDRADANGNFEISFVPADRGLFDVLCQFFGANQVMEGRVDDVSPVGGGVTDVGQVTLLVEIGSVTGLLVDPRGLAVADAQVTVEGGGTTRNTRTDADGRYRVENMSAGDIRVTARDFRTGLRGRTTGVLEVNSSVNLNFALGPFGTIRGTVQDQSGGNVGAGVTVTRGGATTTTDALGEYIFDFVPVGSFTIEAAGPNGNRGRTFGNLSTTGRTLIADVIYLGRGTVTGNVFTGSGAPATQVEITLSSQSVFGGYFTQNTGGGNSYSINNVFVGDFSVSAVSTVSRLAGFGSGRIEGQGDTIAVNLTLGPAGSFTGTVFEVDGSTPVPGAFVVLQPSGRTATTDNAGQYRFDFVPLGSYSFFVTNPANGDRGSAGGSLAAQDQVVNVPINLRGFGAIEVVVTDAGGSRVAGAQVRIDSFSGFDYSRSGVTGSDGTLAVASFLAGPFQVSVSNPVTGAIGGGAASVAAGGSVSVPVQLSPLAQIVGTVFGPDGTTPVPGITLFLGGTAGRSGASGLNGQFAFVNLPLGTYSISARDSRGNTRASATGLVLGSNGQTLQQNLTLNGIGTVEGLVTLETVPQANIPVSLISQVPGNAGNFSANTDVNGRYSIASVPVGGFTVKVNTRRGNDIYEGEATGSIPGHEQIAQANIQLNKIFDPQPTTFFDANNYVYDLDGDGSINNGPLGFFRGNGTDARNFGLLEIVINGTANPVKGEAFGTFEEGGREAVFVDSNVGGLDVTRKVYVPTEGYFARYLEVISNPTANPITFDLNLRSHFRFITKIQGGFRFNREPRVIGTSSGDEVLATGDRWALIDDDDDGDPFLINTLPSTALVFDGGGAVSAVAQNFELNFAQNFGRMTLQWPGLTVPAGEQVIVMHLVAIQSGRNSALQSALRLAQLPPEALNGLTAEERARVVNFNVPGSSTLPSLPPLTGTVHGDVLAGNGTLPVSFPLVQFRSSSPFFNRLYFVNGSASGRFNLAGNVPGNGNSIPISVETFALTAREPVTSIWAPTVAGAFAQGLLEVEQDIVFSNAGILTGLVRRESGEVVTIGSVNITSEELLGNITTFPGQDGTFAVAVYPPGQATVSAILPIPEGTDLMTAVTANVVVGEETFVELVFPHTGDVEGFVFTGGGDPAVNVTVSLSSSSSGFFRSRQTGTGGDYAFLDVPPGNYTLSASEPRTGIPSTAAITITAEQLTEQDLTLIGVGQVEVSATYSSGPAVAGGPVLIQEQVRGANFRFVGYTGANGRFLLANVPVGTFTARVLHPVNGVNAGTFSGTVATHGATVNAPVVVPVDQAPNITLVNPQPGTSFFEGSTLFFSSTVTDDFGVDRVEYRVDGQLVGASGFPPYSVGYTFPQVDANTAVTVVATAVDTGNNTATDSASVTILQDAAVPAVALVSPAAGASFLEGDQINLQATATDNNAVARVEFSVDGEVLGSDSSSPYNWSYRVPDDYAAGGSRSLAILARAFDRSGNQAEATRSVTVNPYNEPAISISDVTLAEGNVGTKDFVFTVSLSETGTRQVRVDYTTAETGSASASVDYLTRSGQLFFNPGELNKTIAVPVLGEVNVEGNETFVVNLSNPLNSTFADGQGVGTITDDDGVAGQLLNFAWETVNSPQFVNEPFAVVVRALDAFGTTVSGYNGSPVLRGLDSASVATGTMLNSIGHSDQFSGHYTLGHSFTPSEDLVVTHVRHYFGTKVSIWTDAGQLLLSQNVASVAGQWRETPVSPVTLEGGTRYRIGVYNSGAQFNYYRTLPTTFAHGAIHNSYHANGDSFPNLGGGTPFYLVDITYQTGSFVSVTPATLNFVNGVFSGNINVSAPGTAVRLQVDDLDGHLGVSNPFDAQLRNDLAVTITDSADPAPIAADLTYTIDVHNSGPAVAEDVVVTIQPPTANVYYVSAAGTHGGTLPVGSAPFDVTVGDLAAGESALFTLVVRPHTDGLATVSASATQSNVDNFPSNNSDQETTRLVGPGTFQISSLGATGAAAVETGSLTGDDRGGIALSDEKVFVTGDSRTAMFNIGDLSGGAATSFLYDALVGDLQSRVAYVLANGNTPLGQGGTATRLLPLAANGQISGVLSAVDLSQPVPLGNNSGLFSGYGRLTFLAGNGQAWEVILPSGLVTPLGAMNVPPHMQSESWAFWGVAEHTGAGRSVVFVEDSQEIVRYTVPEAQRTLLATFANLSDMASITAAPWLNRWYFRHEGTSQFRSGDETVGYADASFSINLQGVPSDLSVVLTQSGNPVTVDNAHTYTITVDNSGPDPLNGVALTGQLPAGAAFVSANTTHGTVNVNSGVLTAAIGDLPDAETAVVTVVVTYASPGNYVWNVQGSRTGLDPYLPNNRGVIGTTVVFPALTIGDVQVTEGNEGTVAARFPVNLSVAVNRLVSVRYNASHNSTDNSDVTLVSNQLLEIPAGQTQGEIVLQVNGDLLHELNEQFRVELFSPVNAVIADATGVCTINNDDAAPGVSAGDASVSEGNVGVKTLTFPVTLSAVSALNTRIFFGLANGTAETPADYFFSGANNFTIPAGQSAGTIAVTIVGEVAIEPAENFFVNLTSAENGTLADAQGEGTIVDDDGIANQIYQFAFATINSPRLEGAPFGVTVTAQDAFGATVTGYNGSPSLRAVDGGTGGSFTILGSPSPTVSSGNFTMGYNLTPTVDLNVTHFRHFYGVRFLVWDDVSGQLLRSQNIASVNGQWTETPLAAPLKLLAGNRYRIGVFNGGGNYYYTGLANAFSHGTIHNSFYSSGEAFPTTVWTVTPMVSLRYNLGEELSAAPAALSGFVNGIWTGNVTVNESGTEVRLFVDDGDGHRGESNPFAVLVDCDGNGVDDATDISNGTHPDVVGANAQPDGIPDVCQDDCNGNLVPDELDISSGTSLDCNDNGVPDGCDIASGTSQDCNNNGVPDECDGNLTRVYEIRAGDLVNMFSNCGSGSLYGSSGQVGFRWTDDLARPATAVRVEFNVGVECHGAGTTHVTTLNGLGQPNFISGVNYCSCNFTPGSTLGAVELDPADYEEGAQNTFLISISTSFGMIPRAEWGGDVYARVYVTYAGDCNNNGVLDECDIASGTSLDVVGPGGQPDGIPDDCQTDCNNNRIPDDLDIASGASEDCDVNGVPDECQPDCNNNGVADACDLLNSRYLLGVEGNAGALYQIDKVTGAQQFLAEVFGYAGFNGLSVDPTSGELYAIAKISNNDRRLVHLTRAGVATELGVFGINVADLAFRRDGTLFAVAGQNTGQPGELFTVDLVDGTLTSTGIVGSAGGGQSIAFDPANDWLFHSANDLLERINTADGSMVLLNTELFEINALTYEYDAAGNQLLAMNREDLYRIDPETGEADFLGGSGHRTITGIVALGGSRDLNSNGVPDECDIANGTSQDCNNNGIVDEVEPDCNENNIPDDCDIANGTSQDVIGLGAAADGIPDECQVDCNGNLIPDALDIQNGSSADCNENGRPDECDIASGTSQDVIGAGAAADGIPDECQVDCNGNLIPDFLDIDKGTSPDCNNNGRPDECEIANGTVQDCNGNGIPDLCEPDCNGNGVPDECDIANGTVQDCNNNGIPDSCDTDCNGNGVPDDCEINSGAAEDCNGNGIPDECDLLSVRVYSIRTADLIGMIHNCGGGSLYGNGQVGFRWTDGDARTPSSVTIEFNVGVECNAAEGGVILHASSLNGQAEEVVQTQAYCNCTLSSGVIETVEGSVASYLPGQQNTFTLQAQTWLGFTPRAEWNGAHARVTVTYVANDCNSNGVPDDCDPDENNNGIPDDCEIQ